MSRTLRDTLMKVDGAESTLATPAAGDVCGDADTQLSPGERPDVLAGPDNRRRRQAVEAALFGTQDAAQFGRHRLLHRLGEGGMGIVYAAYDERLDRKVALKLIRPGRRDDARADERILREARALARLSHPNVVHVYEVGELDGQIFVAMEFLAGPTLRTWLDDLGARSTSAPGRPRRPVDLGGSYDSFEIFEANNLIDSLSDASPTAHKARFDLDLTVG